MFIDPEGTVNREKVFTIAPRLEGNEEMFSFALWYAWQEALRNSLGRREKRVPTSNFKLENYDVSIWTSSFVAWPLRHITLRRSTTLHLNTVKGNHTSQNRHLIMNVIFLCFNTYYYYHSFIHSFIHSLSFKFLYAYVYIIYVHIYTYDVVGNLFSIFSIHLFPLVSLFGTID